MWDTKIIQMVFVIFSIQLPFTKIYLLKQKTIPNNLIEKMNNLYKKTPETIKEHGRQFFMTTLYPNHDKAGVKLKKQLGLFFVNFRQNMLNKRKLDAVEILMIAQICMKIVLCSVHKF